MFTGIVEAVGELLTVTPRGGDVALRIGAPGLLDGVGIGDSISVDGACLTVVAHDRDTFEVEAVPETLARTTLGDRSVGDPLNLELAMRADGRFDGHIVQGHVDGVGTVTDIAEEGGGRRITILPPDDVSRYVVEKGSITVQGVSLTVAAHPDPEFAIAIIPHTLEVTNLGRLRPGDRVNLEADVIAKYVERLTR